jgi:RHS repeat-associated protein
MYSFLGALITKLLSASLNQWRVCFLACVTTPTQTEHFTHEMQVLLHSQTRDGVRQWVAEDGLGSVRMMTDVSGVITETRNYAPYGSVLSQSGTSQTVYGFRRRANGRQRIELQPRTLLQPSLGAFTALDPFEGLEERPMSMNGYSYAENNPANWTDPSGEFVQAALAAAAAIAAGMTLTEFILAVGALLGIAVFSITAIWCNANNCFCQTGGCTLDFNLGDLLGINDAIQVLQNSHDFQVENNSGSANNNPYSRCGALPMGIPNTGCINQVTQELYPTNSGSQVNTEIRVGDYSGANTHVHADEGERDDDDCPYTVRQFFDTPQILAGLTPDDISCAFFEPWKLVTETRGRSNGKKWEYPGPLATIRWSENNVGKRHFRDDNGVYQPYWVLSSPGAKPGKLWVAPDGLLFDTSPIYYGDEITAGTVWTNKMEVLPQIANLIFAEI